jgi:MFS family permease
MSRAGRLRRTVQSTFISLRNRNFRLYFIGQLVSNTGNWLTNVALTLLVLHLTGKGVAVGFLVGCQYGPMLVISPWAGVVADRFDKRRMLILTQSGEMLQSVGLAVLAFVQNPPLAELYILALAGGILLAFDNPARRSFVSEMVPPEDLPNAVVLYSAIVNISRIFGPTLAGLLIVSVGFGWCFTLDAVSYLAVLICLMMMRPAELYHEARSPGGTGGVGEGLRYIGAIPVLRATFIMVAAIGTLSYNFNVTLPLFVISALHSTEGMFTILYSVLSAGAVVCALIVANREFVGMRHVITGAAALGGSMVLLAVVPTAPAAVPAVFLVGMSSILYLTATTTIVQVEGRHDMHGRLLSLQSVCTVGSSIFGGPFLGWLADTMGGRAPMAVGGIVALGAAAYGYFAGRRIGLR